MVDTPKQKKEKPQGLNPTQSITGNEGQLTVGEIVFLGRAHQLPNSPP